jgi:hypothetical protein
MTLEETYRHYLGNTGDIVYVACPCNVTDRDGNVTVKKGERGIIAGIGSGVMDVWYANECVQHETREENGIIVPIS